MAELATRDRLVTEGMRLFSDLGYQATSVAQIEAAAGLAPGSGAMYHHFRSKEALLDAGIDRQLDRRNAMRDIRMLFRGVGELRTDLVLLGRYLLAVIDEERQLLNIAATAPQGQSLRLNSTYGALIHGLCTDVAELAANWSPGITGDAAQALAQVSVYALLGNRIGSSLSGSDQRLPDDAFLAEWTAMVAGRIEAAVADVA